MGVSSFVQRLERRFILEFKKHGFAPGGSNDPNALREHLWEQFALWFLQNRDQLLAEEWAQRGWVDVNGDPVDRSDDSGSDDSPDYRVREDCLRQIEDWLNEEV